MKLAELKRLPSSPTADAVMRTTAGQDAPIEDTRPHWLRHQWRYIGASAGVLLLVTLVWLLGEWSDLKNSVSAERMRVVSVRKGQFVREQIAHELNNSLAPISSLAHSGMMLAREPDSARLERVFTTIADRAAHLATFIDGYAGFAKLPKPRVEVVDWGQ